MVGIYRIINKNDQKSYVGKSVDVKKRVAKHFSTTKKDWNGHGKIDRQIYIQGPKNFTWELICECNAEELNEKEAFYIALFDCCNPEKGYNKCSFDTCVSNNQGKEIVDLDTMEVYKSTGDCARALGLNQGDVVRVCNHQHCSVGGHRLQYLAEYKEKGKMIREQKMSSKAKKVKCVETAMIFESAHEAARNMGLNFRLISSVCNGVRKTTGGYHFVYV